MNKCFMKRTLVTTIFTLLISVYPACSSDYEGHWAQRDIDTLMSQGILYGDEQGNINPDYDITRAEFIAIVNRYNLYKDVFNRPIENFNDVDENAWYANDMLIAKFAGYIQGDENGLSRPNAFITRAEAVKILMYGDDVVNYFFETESPDNAYILRGINQQNILSADEIQYMRVENNGLRIYPTEVGKEKIKIYFDNLPDDFSIGNWVYQLNAPFPLGFYAGYFEQTDNETAFFSYSGAGGYNNIMRLIDVIRYWGDNFSDWSDCPDWAKSYMLGAQYKNRICGYPDGTFRPTNAITRAEAFALLTSADN